MPHGIKDNARFGDSSLMMAVSSTSGAAAPEFARVQQHADSLSEGQGQRCERSFVARQLEVPGGQVVPGPWRRPTNHERRGRQRKTS